MWDSEVLFNLAEWRQKHIPEASVDIDILVPFLKSIIKSNLFISNYNETLQPTSQFAASFSFLDCSVAR